MSSSAYPVFNAGLPRSASTWAFNVAAALLRHARPETPLTLAFSDGRGSADDGLLGEGPILVKTHAPSPLLRAAIVWSGGPVLLTLRDPRDCVASLMTQFGLDFAAAMHNVGESGRALMALVEAASPLVLKYETGFYADGTGIAAIAAHLDVALDADTASRLSAEFSRQSVGEMLSTNEFVQLRTDRLPVLKARPETEWHPKHLGDGRVGKYRTLLAPEQIAVLDYQYRAFMAAFGYPFAAPVPIQSGALIDCTSGGTGAQYLGGGFSDVEDWGTWTIDAEASMQIPLTRRIEAWLTVEFDLRIGPGLRLPDRWVEITLNGHATAFAAYRAAAETDRVRLIVSAQAATLHWHETLVIGLRAESLQSPLEMGIGGDARRLGLGITAVRVGYA